MVSGVGYLSGSGGLTLLDISNCSGKIHGLSVAGASDTHFLVEIEVDGSNVIRPTPSTFDRVICKSLVGLENMGLTLNIHFSNRIKVRVENSVDLLGTG